MRFPLLRPWILHDAWLPKSATTPVLLLRHCLLQLYSADPWCRFVPATTTSDRCKSWTHLTLDHPFHSLPTRSAPLPPQLPASHSRDSYPFRKTKPTKDSHSFGSLVHCTVYPVFAACSRSLFPGLLAPRNRANLFQSLTTPARIPFPAKHLQIRADQSRTAHRILILR